MLDETVQRPPTPMGAHTDDDPRWYHPSRDISIIGPELLRSVFVHFEKLPHPEPFYADLLKDVPLQDQVQGVGDCARALAKFYNVCWHGEENTVTSAAQEAGLMNVLPTGVRAAVLARLGEVLLGSIYASLQDVTPMGGEPVHAPSLRALIKAAEAFASKLAARHPS